MMWLWYGLVFFLGAAVGSFVNVLVSRSVDGEDWVRGRSRCDYCGRELSFWEMVPVVSYLVLRGRSRCCRQELSLQYLVIEVLGGTLFVWWMYLSSTVFVLVTEPGRSIQPMFWLVTAVILLSIALADFVYGVIPLPFWWVGITLTAVYRLVLVGSGSYQALDLGRSILGSIGLSLFYYLLRVLTRKKGMGVGDVYLAGYVGLLLGYPRLLWATLIAFVSGAIVGLLLIMGGKKTRKDTLPFGPFMILGAGVVLLVMH